MISSFQFPDKDSASRGQNQIYSNSAEAQHVRTKTCLSQNVPDAESNAREAPPPTAPVRSAAPPRPTIRIIRTTAADFLATVCDLFRLDNIRIQNPRKLSLQTKFIIQKENTCLTKRKYVYICDTIRTESGHPPENGHGFRLDKVRFRPNVKDRINATV